MPVDVKDVLNELDEEAKEVETAQTGGLPDGSYQARITEPDDGVFVNINDDGSISARFILEVTNAEDDRLIGMATGKSYYLVDPDGNLNNQTLSFLKADLEVMGVGFPEEFGDLGEVLQGLVGSVVEIRLRTREKDSGTYQNIYINNLVNEGASY